MFDALNQQGISVTMDQARALLGGRSVDLSPGDVSYTVPLNETGTQGRMGPTSLWDFNLGGNWLNQYQGNVDAASQGLLTHIRDVYNPQMMTEGRPLDMIDLEKMPRIDVINLINNVPGTQLPTVAERYL